MRLYIYISAVVAAVLFLYFWHYRQIGELDNVKKENVQLKEEVKAVTAEGESKEFEAKHKAIKETLQTQKKESHDEINTTIGKHTIIID